MKPRRTSAKWFEGYEWLFGQTLWFSDELFGPEEEREGNAVDRRGTR